MTAEIISGTKVAAEMRVEMKKEVAELKEKHGVIPGLAVVLIGEDPASQVYVGSKVKTCGELEVNSFEYRKPADFPEADLLKLIDELNKDPKVDGIDPIGGTHRRDERNEHEDGRVNIHQGADDDE